MVLSGIKPRLMTEDSLNSQSKCLYKKYVGSCDMNIESIKSICENHREVSVLQELFSFTIGWMFGFKSSSCCTLAVDFMNTKMNYNLKNRSNPKKLMKEIRYDSNYDCGTS